MASFHHRRPGRSANPALPTPKFQHGRIHGTSPFLVQFRPYSVVLNVQWFRLFYDIEYVNGLFSLSFQDFPAAHSRVVIRLAQDTKAKPNANTRTLRPDKCLVVKSLDSSLRPLCPSQHGIHRHHHQGVEGREGRPLLRCQPCFPLAWTQKIQTVPSLALSRRDGQQRADDA